MIAAINPEKIFIMVGVNDILLSKGDMLKIADDYKLLLNSIDEVADAEIYIQSVPACK